jgi:hypothetical protein
MHVARALAALLASLFFQAKPCALPCIKAGARGRSRWNAQHAAAVVFIKMALSRCLPRAVRRKSCSRPVWRVARQSERRRFEAWAAVAFAPSCHRCTLSVRLLVPPPAPPPVVVVAAASLLDARPTQQ